MESRWNFENLGYVVSLITQTKNIKFTNGGQTMYHKKKRKQTKQNKKNKNKKERTENFPIIFDWIGLN